MIGLWSCSGQGLYLRIACFGYEIQYYILRVQGLNLSNTIYLWLVTFLETYQEMTMTMVSCLICKGIAMRNDPTHPPGFWKVHRYAKEWCGLLIRGCNAQRLSLTISIALSKKNPALSYWDFAVVIPTMVAMAQQSLHDTWLIIVLDIT